MDGVLVLVVDRCFVCYFSNEKELMQPFPRVAPIQIGVF
jgi:hypothetical protein